MCGTRDVRLHITRLTCSRVAAHVASRHIPAYLKTYSPFAEDSLDADEMGWDSSSSHGPCWSPGGSADTAMNSKGRRPRRACRKATDAVVQLQAEEEMEERRKVMDQRTFRLKEKNKR